MVISRFIPPIGGVLVNGLREADALAEDICDEGAETVSKIETLVEIVDEEAPRRDGSFFCGTDYLGLSGNRFMKAASALAVLMYGTSFSASRTTTGTSGLHLLAERQVAAFMGEEDACLLVSGEHANAVLLEVLARRHACLFYEQSTHPSVIDAAKGWFGRTESFDQDDLEAFFEAARGVGSAVIAMNGIDPATGRVAPLDKIMALSSRGDISIVVDDCHAVGVLGPNGRGTPEYYGIAPGRVYQSATMSKAFGCSGGFVSGSSELCGAIRATRAYIGASALPPPNTAACLMALGIASKNPRLRGALRSNVEYAARQLRLLGLEIPYDATPVLQITNITGDAAERLVRRLRECGIDVSCIRYPTIDSPRRLRIVIRAAHTRGDIDRLCSAIRLWRHDG